jgi:aliphatic sulfonates family ABC transporter substrate-binding protein
MSKKILSILFVLVFIMGVLTGCGGESTESAENTESTGDEVTIRVAVQKSIAIPYLAEALGYYKDEFSADNVNVELVEFSLGPEVIEAVASGEIDIGFLGDVPAFSGLINGGDYKIVARWESDNSSYLITRDDANIKSLQDLRGKKVSYAFGSTQTALVYAYLEDAGLTDSDVELMNLSLADSVTSIANGDVDAAVVDELRATQAVEKGGVSKLMNSEGYKLFVSPIIATNDFTSKHGDLTGRVLKVIERAAEYAEKNPDDAVTKAAERIGVEESAIEPIIKNCDLEVYLGQEEKEAIIENAAQAYKYDVIKQELDIEKYIDTSYLEEAGLTKQVKS